MGFFSKIAGSNPLTSGIEGEYNLNKEMAKRTEQDAQYGAALKRREAGRLLKDQIAAFGASGVELEGSAMELIKQDQVDAELEAMNIIYSGKTQAAEMKYRSRLQKQGAYASLAMQGGSMALGRMK